MADSFPEDLVDLFPSKADCLNPYFAVPDKGDPRIWSGVSRDAWKNAAEYLKTAANPKRLAHDEPWLTLVGLYGVFGDQSDLEAPKREQALNALMEQAFSKRTPTGIRPEFSKIAGVHLEVLLHENLIWRKYLLEQTFQKGPWHPYLDVRETLGKKVSGDRPSLEGSTNLDALISGTASDGRPIHIFVEAKFLSDIDTKIKYLPVRNQIIRNIDCALDLLTKGGKELEGIEDLWFLLLTPGVFRSQAYGGPVESPISSHQPGKGRFFSYKMDEYLDPEALRAELPHWHEKLPDNTWEKVSRRIGWLVFEDMAGAVKDHALLEGAAMAAFQKFMLEREIRVLGW